MTFILTLWYEPLGKVLCNEHLSTGLSMFQIILFCEINVCLDKSKS